MQYPLLRYSFRYCSLYMIMRYLLENPRHTIRQVCSVQIARLPVISFRLDMLCLQLVQPFQKEQHSHFLRKSVLTAFQDMTAIELSKLSCYWRIWSNQWWLSRLISPIAPSSERIGWCRKSCQISDLLNGDLRTRRRSESRRFYPNQEAFSNYFTHPKWQRPWKHWS